MFKITKDMKLRCFKNLVVADSILIMKGDLIEIISGEETKSGVMNYDIMVLDGGFMDGIEATVSIHDIAGHFEYLEK